MSVRQRRRACRGAVLLCTGFACWGMVGCLAEDGGATIEAAVGFTGQCQVATTTDIGSGIFDPSGGQPFMLGLRIASNLPLPEQSPIGPDGAALHPGSGTATLIGFESCFFLDDTLAIENISGQTLVDCKDLPRERTRFIAAAGGVGGFPRGVAIPILTRGDLQGLFGAGFEPTQIPLAAPVLVDGVVERSQALASRQTPAVGQRDVAWGNFPETAVPVVVVQLRAKLKRVGGTVFNSNWFQFPVEVLPGRANTQCGTLRLRRCTTTCPLGAQCGEPTGGVLCGVNQPSTCTAACVGSAATCVTYGLRGLSFGGSTCLPYQFAGSLICQPLDACI